MLANIVKNNYSNQKNFFNRYFVIKTDKVNFYFQITKKYEIIF